jgi:hypothetical protein
MAFGSYLATAPRVLTPEEEAAIAAEAAAAQGQPTAAPPPPPEGQAVAPGATQTTTAAPPPQEYVAPPPTQTYEYPNAGPQGNATPLPTPTEIPASAPPSALGATQTTQPQYQASPPAVSSDSVEDGAVGLARPGYPTVNTGTTTGDLPSGPGNIGLPGLSERYRVDQAQMDRGTQSNPGAFTPTIPSGDFLKNELGRFLGLNPERKDLDQANQFQLNVRQFAGDVGGGFRDAAKNLATVGPGALLQAARSLPTAAIEPDPPDVDGSPIWTGMEDAFGPLGVHTAGAFQHIANSLPMADERTENKNALTAEGGPVGAFGDFMDRGHQLRVASEKNRAELAAAGTPAPVDKVQAGSNTAADLGELSSRWAPIAGGFVSGGVHPLQLTTPQQIADHPRAYYPDPAAPRIQPSVTEQVANVPSRYNAQTPSAIPDFSGMAERYRANSADDVTFGMDASDMAGRVGAARDTVTGAVGDAAQRAVAGGRYLANEFRENSADDVVFGQKIDTSKLRGAGKSLEDTVNQANQTRVMPAVSRITDQEVGDTYRRGKQAVEDTINETNQNVVMPFVDEITERYRSTDPVNQRVGSTSGPSVTQRAEDFINRGSNEVVQPTVEKARALTPADLERNVRAGGDWVQQRADEFITNSADTSLRIPGVGDVGYDAILDKGRGAADAVRERLSGGVGAQEAAPRSQADRLREAYDWRNYEPTQPKQQPQAAGSDLPSQPYVPGTETLTSDEWVARVNGGDVSGLNERIVNGKTILTIANPNGDPMQEIPVGFVDADGNLQMRGKDVDIQPFWDEVNGTTTSTTQQGTGSGTTATQPKAAPTLGAQGNVVTTPQVATTPQPETVTQNSSESRGGGSSGGGYTNNGGGNRGGYSNSNSYDYPRSSSKRSTSVGQMFADDGDEMDLNDFIKDYNGNGEVDEEDRRTASKRFASYKKKRGRKGKTRTSTTSNTSNVPQREDSPIRTKTLNAIKTSTRKSGKR